MERKEGEAVDISSEARVIRDRAKEVAGLCRTDHRRRCGNSETSRHLAEVN